MLGTADSAEELEMSATSIEGEGLSVVETGLVVVWTGPTALVLRVVMLAS